MRIKGRIRVAKQVLEERLEIETLAMEDITSAMHNYLSILHRSFLLFLNLNKEPM